MSPANRRTPHVPSIMAQPTKRIIVSVFGSSHPREGDADYAFAYDLGALLARQGYTVCNGGYGGVMEASARGAKSAGGTTIGVTFRASGGRAANPWIDEVIEMETLMERLHKLISLGDAYAVLRGGTGTMLELAAVWEFLNKRMMPPKPVVALGTFWADVVHTLREQLRAENSAAAEAVALAHSPQQFVDVLRTRLSTTTTKGA